LLPPVLSASAKVRRAAVQAADGGEDFNEDYYAAAGEPNEAWAVPKGGHVGSQAAEPDRFERRVVGFFDAALLYDSP
jgi:hypothetical protein